mgnify:CR=1 FL=1
MVKLILYILVLPLHIIKKYYNNSLKINLFKFRKGYENGKEKY